jgi:hypothetical protein
LTLKQQVQSADAIAVVTITQTKAESHGAYQKVAVAHVDRALKGVAVDSVELLFDSPQSPAGRDPQSYSQGERCLIFMTRASEGRYITFQSAFGKHLVSNGKAELSDGHGVWTETLEAVGKEILASSPQPQRH